MNRTTPSDAGCPAAIALDMAIDIASTIPSPNTLFRTAPALIAVTDADRFALFRMFPPLCRVTRKTGGVTRRHAACVLAITVGRAARTIYGTSPKLQPG
ncbi:hypothetical protein BconGalA64_13610 [Burkholderia contaminans]|nr:hypothetical protein BconGalA64_13610 [Burkholderia contaminans]